MRAMRAMREKDAPPRLAGIGIGLRRAFARELLDAVPDEVDWVEIHPENYVRRGGPFRAHLERALATWPVIPHGLTLCFGDAAAPDEAEWLRSLRSFLDDINAPFYSDHLCIAGAAGGHSHDLLPMPRNAATIRHVVDRIHRIEDAIGRPVAVENVSAYDEVHGDMPEQAFVAEVLDRSDALLLLDVNNVVVNAANFSFDAHAYVRALPLERVAQIHIAGHEIGADGMRIDTHAEPAGAQALALLEDVLRLAGPRPVLLERDSRFPPLAELLAELRVLRAIAERAAVTSSSADAATPGAGAAGASATEPTSPVHVY